MSLGRNFIVHCRKRDLSGKCSKNPTPLQLLLTGDRLQEDASDDNGSLVQGLELLPDGVAGCQVEGFAQSDHGIVGSVVNESDRLPK